MGEVAAFARVLAHTGILTQIQEQVRFARARFGKSRAHRFCCCAARLHAVGRADEAFVLRTTHAVGRRLYGPGCRAIACLIAPPCLGISLLSIKRVWRRSGRYAQKDVLARKPFPSPGGLFDRTDQQWIVIDVDGTMARGSSTRTAADGPVAHSPSPGGIRSARQAIKAASEVKLFVPVLLYFRRIRISFSARRLSAGQRGLPRRSAMGHPGDHELCRHPWGSLGLLPRAVRWPVWRRRPPS